MSGIADILKRLDALMEGQNAAQRSVPQLPAEFKPRDISPVLGAPEKKHPTSGYFVGGESQGDVKEYMPMPEPLTDDTVMELSPDTLARYRAAAMQDKQFNLRGIAQANRMAQEKERQGDLGAVDDWQDEAQFFRSVNAKRNRGIARADRGLKRAGDDINEISDFKRREIEHELRHEAPNNYQVNIDGRRWKVFGDRAHAEAVARKLQAKGKKVDIYATGAAVSESATTEDVVSKGGKNLGDYLQDVAKIIKKDPELLDRVAQELDKLGPAVKTLHTDDGHEIKIHGNEDDGFRISIKNKTAKGRFRDLDEARMAVELFVARRRKHSADNSDYVDEK